MIVASGDPGAAVAPPAASKGVLVRRAVDVKGNDCPFVCISKVGMEQYLHHLVLNESVFLRCTDLGLQEVLDGVFSLTIEKGAGILWYNEAKVAPCSVVFSKALYLADHLPYTVAKGGDLAWLQESLTVDPYKFFRVSVAAAGSDCVFKTIQLADRAPGAQWCHDMAHLHSWQCWSAVHVSQALRNLARSVMQWGSHCDFTPSALYLKGGTKRFDKPLEKDSLSSTGFLVALLILSCRSQREDMEARHKYSALLYGVVETFFDLDDIPLRIPISSASAVDVSSPCPPTGFVQMHIDRCKLYFDDDSKPAQIQVPWIN